MDMSLEEIAHWNGYGDVKALKAAIEAEAELSPDEIKALESGEPLRPDRCERVQRIFFGFLRAAQAAKQWSEQKRLIEEPEERRALAREAARREAKEKTHLAEARERAQEYWRRWLDWLAPEPVGPGS